MMASKEMEINPDPWEHEPEVEGKLDRLLEGVAHTFPGNASLMQFFQVGFLENRINPNSVAIKDEEKSYTFKDLDVISSKITTILKNELGEKYSNQNPDGDIVFGVCLPPSDKLIFILFAILKLGGAYLPFEPSFPEDRVIRIVTQARPVMIISDGHETTLAKFDPVKHKTNVVSSEHIWQTSVAAKDQIKTTIVEPLLGAQNLSQRTAIVLFTSGSSGEPKGVRLSHRTVMNRLNWGWHRFPFTPDENCVFKTALTFVDSVPEIFGPLLQGHHIVVFSRLTVTHSHLFVQKVYDYKITRIVLVPSFLQALLTMLDVIEERDTKWTALDSVKLWICSGETLTLELLQHFFKSFPTGKTLCNFYGSTEIMGDVTFIQWSSLADIEKTCIGGHVPLGQPIHNTVIYILDSKFQMVKEGEVGEIFVAGYNLAKGYVNLKESDKFIFNLFSKTHGYSKLYRTGDFGHIQHTKDGRRALFFDGRLDSQIKVRGHRVDLSEVEAVINELTLVKKCVVLCYHAGQHDQAVIAFVVPHEDGTAGRIGFTLEMKLLKYQYPIIRIVKEIPLLVNGKTDRQRLLFEYHQERLNRSEFDTWEELGIDPSKLATFKILILTISKVTGTSVHDIVQDLEGSFYNIGGTSLNSLTVIAELKKLNYGITIHEFVSAKTIRELHEAIRPIDPNSPLADSRIGLDARKKLTPEILNDSHKAEVIAIISSSFAHKGDLEVYVHVTYPDFEHMIGSMWPELVEKGYSYVVRRRTDAKIIGVSLNFDAYDEPGSLDACSGLRTIIAFLDDIEEPHKKNLPQGKGKLLSSFMMGTHEDLTEAENVYLIEFMEEENVRVGNFHNFVGILTVNTSPLTQQIGTHVQGYTELETVYVNQYKNQAGEQPFLHAPDSQIAIVCWKKIEA